MATLAAPSDLFDALFDLPLTGNILYTPIYDEAGEVMDFAFARLNAAAQRLLGLPAQPTVTYRQQCASHEAAGDWAFHREAFLASEPRELRQNSADYYVLVARRVGQQLLASFPVTNDQARSAVQPAAPAEPNAQGQGFYDVLQQLPAQVATYTGPDHVFTFVNSRFESFVPAAAVLGRPARAAAAGAIDDAVFALFDEVYATGKVVQAHEVEVRLPHPLATKSLFVNTSYHPLRDSAGRIYGVLDFSYDVTEQVLARRQVEQLNQELEARVLARTREAERAQAAAEVQRRRLEQLFMQAPAAICILDGPDLVYELVNPGYQQLFPGRALLGRPLLEALPELTDQPVWHTLQRVYQTGQPHQELGICIPVAPTEGGPLQNFYFNYIQQARFDTDGHVDGAVVFAFDVTEQVLARQQAQALNEVLRDTNARLTRTNVDLDTFVYAASHDLKAPIANIEGLLNALRDYLPPQQQEPMVPRLVEMMERAIGRFQQTVGHLTNISHLQAAGPTTETADLAAVLADVRLDLQPLLESTHAELQVAMAASPPVRFSVKNLRSVLFNLLSNALKYRAPERAPRVQVGTHLAAGQLVLAVQDNGLGLDAEQQSQLFTMFRRLHTHVEGSGVGLYLLKRLVENANGTVTVQSEPGRGSTFVVTLPLA